MSRHIRAQKTPTHASAFHLFAVAMTGHAEEKGFSYRNMKQLNRCCRNAVKESRSERVGLYQNEQGFFCLPSTSEDNIVLHRCHQSCRQKHRRLRRDGNRQTEKDTINAMRQYDA